MFCCTCAGSCCHTGPHTQCEKHSGNVNVIQVTPANPCLAGVCPSCGYCPTCGRKNADVRPWHPWNPGPVWIFYSTYTCGPANSFHVYEGNTSTFQSYTTKIT